MTGVPRRREDGPGPVDPGLTSVDLIHVPDQIEHWIRFGQPCAESIIDRRRRRLWFRPGSVFGYVRWRANAFGTVASRIDIAAAARPGDAVTAVIGIAPAVVSLLQLGGWPTVSRVLAAIDTIEALGLDPVDACPDHWRQVHHHLSGRSEPRPYTLARHRAWALRRAASC